MQYRVTLRLCTKTYYFKRVEDHKLNARELSTFLFKIQDIFMVYTYASLCKYIICRTIVFLAFIFEILFFIQ